MEFDNRSEMLSAVRVARRDLLNLLDATYGDTQHWPFLRSRILGTFGKKGLEGVAMNSAKGKEVIHAEVVRRQISR
jgi:hypothetical protein